MLAEADRLAWLKNWSRAEPLFLRAEEMFSAAGDERNALYSRISAIRGRLPQLPLIEVSQTLSDYLGTPIVQNDTKLKLRCLVVKGDVDMDFDDGLAQEDWTAALALAKSLKDPDWEARATGELGTMRNWSVPGRTCNPGSPFGCRDSSARTKIQRPPARDPELPPETRV